MCCGPHSFPEVPDGDGSLPASLACSATLACGTAPPRSSSPLLLPAPPPSSSPFSSPPPYLLPFSSALHLLLLPPCFTLATSLRSSLISSSPSLHDTVTPYYSLFKFVQETRNILRKQLSSGQIMALQPGGIQGPGRAKASPGCHHTNGHGDREAVWLTQLR